MTIPVSRAFSGTQDLQSMLDLLVAVRPADRITDYPGICRDDDTARIALLERHGFVRQAVSSLRMIRPLDEKWIGMPGARAR